MRAFVVFLALAVLAVAGVQIFQAGLADAGAQTEIAEESFNPSAGTVQQLQASKLDNAYYSQSVQVRNENSDRSIGGEDYEWFEQNGTIKPLVGGNLDGDTSATINYSYRQTTSRQRGFAATLSQIPSVMGLALPVGLVLAMIAALRGS